ncbi:hypothetical protein ACJMK2_016560 [Sinanodonta woodiana]|uniref:Cysteine and tyrosine-rich protein 1 n=1 Tax=Sinanodonta woodiana TaxID=1069815 RepID=A0ABD3UXF3_SINWO
MAQNEVYLLMFLIIFVGHVKSSSFCSDHDYTGTKYCPYGCCGSRGYQYCCSDYSPVYTVGAIVGIVIGCLAGLGILISVIVCCCCRPCGRATSGQVLQPHPAFSVSSLTTTNGTTMPITQLTPGMYSPSYPMYPQMAEGYFPGNAAVNYSYGAPQSMNNPNAAPPPDYNSVANK